MYTNPLSYALPILAYCLSAGTLTNILYTVYGFTKNAQGIKSSENRLHVVYISTWLLAL